MRVLINGTAMEVERIVPICEQRYAYNGREDRKVETASKIDYANGLAFLPAQNSGHDIFCAAIGSSFMPVMLGNLSNAFVKETLASLTKQGFADFSDLKLQKEKIVTASYTFDNGESDAYMVRGYEVNMCFGSPMTGFPFMNGENPAESDAEDAYADDGEDVEESEDE